MVSPLGLAGAQRSLSPVMAEVRAVMHHHAAPGRGDDVQNCSRRPVFQQILTARTPCHTKVLVLSTHLGAVLHRVPGSEGVRRQELWRHMVDQPHPVVGKMKAEALPVHAKGIDPEDEWLAVTLTDALRGRRVDGQMHLLP